MTNLILRVNKHATIDDSFIGAPSQYVDLEAADSLIFSAGSAVVIDGADLDDVTQPELNKAATLLSPNQVTIVAHYFLSDNSTEKLDEIHLAGDKSKQYVFCASFDGPTSSEPQLEAWDDRGLVTYDLVCLGAGTPASSWYRAACTKYGPLNPASVGIPLAGSGVSNVVPLNGGDGALDELGTGEDSHDLYFNFCVRIPAAVTNAGSYLPVLIISYTTN